jgi:thioredoxin reductase
MKQADFDVIIVGAGLSGIGAAYYLQERCPGKSYAILEGRGAIGGTWDLFRYPGIRSDSDMHTLGYDFKPWKERKAIADGPSILNYVRETAAENGIDQHIKFNHLVREASWDSEAALWTLRVDDKSEGSERLLTCRMLQMCAGYYSYEGGYKPDFPGESSFGGKVIHPQAWPEDLDYAGKKVVVIGGGDTAMDCVRTSIRQGAESVKCLYRRDRANMPGSQREVQNAEEEGVIFEWLSAPKGFVGDPVTGVMVQKMRLGAPDVTGRQAPEVIEGADYVEDADLVIMALGFEPEDLPTLWNEPELPVNRWGTIKADYVTGATALDGVYAVGDIVRGASLVVWAIKDGRDCAQAILDDFNGAQRIAAE